MFYGIPEFDHLLRQTLGLKELYLLISEGELKKSGCFVWLFFCFVFFDRYICKFDNLVHECAWAVHLTSF